MSTRYDIAGIGNAIVDAIVRTDDDLLASQGLSKGNMTLVDSERVRELYQVFGHGVERSGGSVANTMAGIANLGGKGCFIGKVRDDALGATFRKDLTESGVDFVSAPALKGPATAICLVLVTPDAQRTMNTYLGACSELTPDDVDDSIIADSAITYLEGYLWDPPQAKEAYLKATMAARVAGRKVALSLSDSFCVERHREEFVNLVEHHVDILFANEDEVLALYEETEFSAIFSAVRAQCEIAVLTRGERGSVVITQDEVLTIDAEPVKKIVDTTGAGDLYAAGFLRGIIQKRSLHECARMGSIVAAEVISQIGARTEKNLEKLITDNLG